jgi:transposase
MQSKGWQAWLPTDKVAIIGGRFDEVDALQAELIQHMQAGPGAAAQQVKGVTPAAPPPSRWQLVTIRATIDWLHDYSLSGVWYLLQRCGLKLRSAAVQHYSPDPDYLKKVFHLKKALREAARNPRTVATLFLDEFGYTRWPEPARDWSVLTPLARRSPTNNQQWRTIGALNALTGKVSYLDAYIIGRAKVIEFYGQLNQAYRRFDTVYVIQDNWSIHQHPDVLQALDNYPRLHPVWLPTYAPWLNPIEKLWRWVRQDILKLHRLANAWEELRHRVRSFLDQFTHGSTALLRYVGLLGEGLLAKTIRLA